jgi:hypothetical protein
MTKKRILYLSNHNTLSKVEIPMLLEMGYEVYMPKKAAFDVSCTVNWDYDRHLSIPSQALARLNETDFYHEPVTEEITEIMNRCFDIAFVSPYQVMFKSVALHFRGVIVLRAYGHSLSYTQVLTRFFLTPLMGHLEKIAHRFFFGFGYDNMPQIEGRFLRGRGLFLPLGLPDAYVTDKWVGGGGKILFPCAKINFDPIFKKIYDDFIAEFGDLPHIITGVQPIEVTTDINVVGYLSREEYERVYATSACMFYNSQVRTHIHYTPLEAIRCGLPLLFLSDGMLDELGGKNLPGRCQTNKEARWKMKRLLGGDRKLAEEIRRTQPVLLKKFEIDFIKDHWKLPMATLENCLRRLSGPNYGGIQRKRRLGIIMPFADTGPLLNFSIKLCKIIVQGLQNQGETIEIVFAHPDDSSYHKVDFFKELMELGISVRPFEWRSLTRQTRDMFLGLKDWDENKAWDKFYFTYEGDYAKPYDHMANFKDCDHLLFTDVYNYFPLLLERPYSVIAHDYAHRFPAPNSVTSISRYAFHTAIKDAEVVYSPNKVVLEHIIQFPGVVRSKTAYLPVLQAAYQADPKATREISSNYFVLFWDDGRHINHEELLQALLNYYLSGGKHKCRFLGNQAWVLDPKSPAVPPAHMARHRDFIRDNFKVKKHLRFLKDISPERLRQELLNARYLIQPGKWDKRSYRHLEAYKRGVPSLLARNPATEEALKACGIQGVYFDPDVPESLTTLMLTDDRAPNYLTDQTAIRAINRETAEASLADITKQIIFNSGL